ncbi:MAG: hypothetical protein DI625_17140 [Sphingomonas sp.]|nr:MAG: hypothetical protein DI625_17140 [Sphingomonas sp.]
MILLSACGLDEPADNLASTEPVEVRTCESIRDDVIRIAGQNGVNIVKIYEPQTLVDTPDKLDCSGRVLVSSGQEAKLYYRSFKDADGDRLVQYSEQKMD